VEDPRIACDFGESFGRVLSNAGTMFELTTVQPRGSTKLVARIAPTRLPASGSGQRCSVAGNRGRRKCETSRVTNVDSAHDRARAGSSEVEDEFHPDRELSASNEVCWQLEDVVSRANDERERRRDLRGLSDAASPAVPRSCARIIDLDVSWLVPADLAAVDVLARFQVAAARRRSQLRLHGADGTLAELIEFCGLGDVVQLCSCCRTSTRPVHDPDTEG